MSRDSIGHVLLKIIEGNSEKKLTFTGRTGGQIEEGVTESAGYSGWMDGWIPRP
jgi:hypothetical protein